MKIQNPGIDMTCSMTAYAYVERPIADGVLSCEIKTVNHRYLDLSLRTAEILKPLEIDVAARIRSRLARGRVECTINIKQRYATPLPKLDDRVLVALAGQINKAESILRDMGLKLAPPSVLDVMKWRDVTDVTNVTAEEPDDLEQVGNNMMQLLDQTLDALVKSRQDEGGRLEKFIQACRDKLASTILQLRQRYPQVLSAARENLERKLTDLDVGLDPQRMAQEAALLAQKFFVGADIEEELDRCDSHLEESGAIFKRTGPVGRRLDFLMQELNREINTISSKSVDTETVHAAVDAKTLVEKMREQIQNIE